MSFFKKQSPTEKSSGYLLYIIGAILIATIGIQLYNTVWPRTENISMLPKAPDRVELVKFEDIASYTLTPVSLPEKIFGSQLYVIGVYPTAVQTFPAHSVAIAFTKNNARFAEMDIFPNTKLKKFSVPFTAYPQETVIISPTQTGKLIHLRNGFDCTHPKANTIPSMCFITNLLLFEHNGTLIQLSADGDHISEGEMIEMARSIK